jgi:Cu-processing system permease protein
MVLFTVPLVSGIFSTIYMYNSAEFIELLLSQPVRRRKIWRSLFYGLLVSLVLAFLIGCGIPLMIFAPDAAGLMTMAGGCLVTGVFVALAMLASVLTRDKAKGIGISILLWLFFALLFDGIVLFLLFQFGDYPVEKPMVFVSALNPIDLARIMILLHLDVSAMMGYTGAIFRDFFGSTAGIGMAALILLAWVIWPYMLSVRIFRKSDL